MITHLRQPLPESLILTDVIRIGEVSTTIQTFIRLGMVMEDGGKYFRIANYRPNAIHSNTPAPNPFSLRELERAGWKVVPGKTADQDLVMFAPGSYCTISNAIRHGLLTNIIK
jgi:hypothetical protein